MVCPDCGKKMYVARTTPSEDALRTDREYRCGECDCRLATREEVYQRLAKIKKCYR